MRERYRERNRKSERQREFTWWFKSLRPVLSVSELAPPLVRKLRKGVMENNERKTGLEKEEKICNNVGVKKGGGKRHERKNKEKEKNSVKENRSLIKKKRILISGDRLESGRKENKICKNWQRMRLRSGE